MVKTTPLCNVVSLLCTKPSGLTLAGLLAIGIGWLGFEMAPSSFSKRRSFLWTAINTSLGLSFSSHERKKKENINLESGLKTLGPSVERGQLSDDDQFTRAEYDMFSTAGI